MENIIYELKEYSDSDYKFVYEIKKQAYIDYVVEFWGEWVEKDQIAYFNEYILKQKNFIKIIIFGGQQIGFLDVCCKDDICEIGNICIEEKYRGKGIGTQILKDVLIENKNKEIKLQYFKSNKVGKLYKRLGFCIINETKTHYQMVKKRV